MQIWGGQGGCTAEPVVRLVVLSVGLMQTPWGRQWWKMPVARHGPRRDVLSCLQQSTGP